MKKQPAELPYDLLTIGDRLQVQPVSSSGEKKALGYGSIAGVIENQALILVDVVCGAGTGTLHKEQVLNARLLVQGGVFSFQTTVLSIHNTPLHHVYLRWPAYVERYNLRTWPRVGLTHDVQVLSSTPFANGLTEVPGKLRNISVNGALVEAPTVLGATGTRVTVRGTFRMGPHVRDMAIPAEVRNQRVGEDRQSGLGFGLHGLKLNIEDEVDAMFFNGFVYEQIHLAKTRSIL